MPKKKLNPFARYMFGLKETYPDMSMAEITKLAGVHWEKMDPKEKEKYKTSNCKVENVDTRTRYNCLGQSIDEVDRAKLEKYNKDQNDIEFIENKIQAAIDKNSLLKEEFYFFCASYFVKMMPHDIYPAEIALAKFSLAEGITNVLHMLINPGELPLGMACTALQHAKKTHKLELPPNTFGETNYHKILDEILKFLKVKELSSSCVPPFYVFDDFLTDDYSASVLTLEKIANENKCYNGFRVLRAEQLLFSLNQKVHEHFKRDEQVPLKSLIQAKDAMRRDNYRYSEIGCDVHNNDDNNQECALSKVKRWGFLIVEHCGLECIDKISGQHFPIRNEIIIDDFDDQEDENVESLLTESMHQLRLNESTISEIDTLSFISETPKISSFASQLTLKHSMSFNTMKKRLNVSSLKNFDSFLNDSQTDISNAPSVQYFESTNSITNIDDTVNNYGESWTKALVKNHLDDD